MVVFWVIIGYEHIHIIEFSTFGFMDGWYYNICPRNVTEIFYWWFKYKFFEVTMVFYFIGLLK